LNCLDAVNIILKLSKTTSTARLSGEVIPKELAILMRNKNGEVIR
jgi:hypothetical protein